MIFNLIQEHRIEMTERTLEQRIVALIEKLSLPPSAIEVREGWTDKSKSAIKKLLEDLLSKLRAGRPLPPVNISRGMDTWGITSGEILEEGAAISNELRRRREP
jgi:hypothetical protein